MADCLGPLPRSKKGNTSLLVLIDKFSKWVELIPTKRATANDVVKALRERIIFRFGCLTIFLSDNGVQFTSRLVKSFLQENGIEHRTTALYSPHENATERMNRVVKTMIAQNTGSDHRNWDECLPEIAFAINTATQESSKYTPAEIIFGRNLVPPNSTNLPRIPEPNDAHKREIHTIWDQVKENNQKASKYQQKYYNMRRRRWTPEVGSRVWKRERQLSSAADNFNQKLAEKFSGPFTVSSVINSNIVTLSDQSKRKLRVHVQDLKPFIEREPHYERC